jgi:hypothetical protein
MARATKLPTQLEHFDTLIGSASQEVPDHKKDRPGAEVGDEELDRTPGYMSLMNFFSHRQLRTSFKAM